MSVALAIPAHSLGNAQTVVAAAPQIASGALTAASSAGVSWAAAAIPFVGVALAGITLWIGAMFKRGAQKEAATAIVNQIEPQMQANLAAYMDSPRTAEAQAQALANFDAMWSAVLQACSDKSLGDAGKRCISERQQGGIAPWCTTPDKRGCDWFVRYRDPIAQDTVQSETASFDAFTGSFTEGSNAAWLAIVGLAIAAMVL